MQRHAFLNPRRGTQYRPHDTDSQGPLTPYTWPRQSYHQPQPLGQSLPAQLDVDGPHTPRTMQEAQQTFRQYNVFRPGRPPTFVPQIREMPPPQLMPTGRVTRSSTGAKTTQHYTPNPSKQKARVTNPRKATHHQPVQELHTSDASIPADSSGEDTSRQQASGSSTYVPQVTRPRAQSMTKSPTPQQDLRKAQVVQNLATPSSSNLRRTSNVQLTESTDSLTPTVDPRRTSSRQSKPPARFDDYVTPKKPSWKR